jgi:hypothetical protein
MGVPHRSISHQGIRKDFLMLRQSILSFFGFTPITLCERTFDFTKGKRRAKGAGGLRDQTPHATCVPAEDA